MLAVTFFCSNLRVRTQASTNAWILSMRRKHLLVGWCTIRWKRQYLGLLIRPTSSGSWTSGNLSLLPLWSKWKTVTTCSSLKEYTFDGNLDSWLSLALPLFCFGGASPDNSTAMERIFPFGLGRLSGISPLVVDTPLVLGHWGLKFLSRFLGYLSLFNKLFSHMVFENSHTNIHPVEEVVSARMKRHG